MDIAFSIPTEWFYYALWFAAGVVVGGIAMASRFSL